MTKLFGNNCSNPFYSLKHKNLPFKLNFWNSFEQFFWYVYKYEVVIFKYKYLYLLIVLDLSIGKIRRKNCVLFPKFSFTIVWIIVYNGKHFCDIFFVLFVSYFVSAIYSLSVPFIILLLSEMYRSCF